MVFWWGLLLVSGLCVWWSLCGRLRCLFVVCPGGLLYCLVVVVVRVGLVVVADLVLHGLNVFSV